MKIKEYAQLDAIDVVQLIKKSQFSAKDVLDSALNQIETLNPKLNSVIFTFYDLAKKQLEKADKNSPLYGTVILLKDSLHDIEGTFSTLGSKLLRNNISTQTSTFVKRLLDAGCIVVGKTNLPEFALMGTTEPKLFGPTRNPFNLAYSPGGSSGGSAASVASGMVSVATGNDGGGSIRIPASMCGLFGFKPSRYFTPMGSEFFDTWMGLVVNHVLTKSVRDSALFLDIEYGFDGPIYFKKPIESFLEELNKPLEPLKIALNTHSYFGSVNNENVRATLEVAKILESFGHIIEEDEPKVDFEKLYDTYIDSMFIETAFLLDYLENKLHKKITIKDVEPSTYILAKIGDKLNAKLNIQIKHLWDKTGFYMRSFFEKYDVYMTPTLANPHIELGSLLPSSIEEFALKSVSKLDLCFYIKPIVKKIAFKQLSAFPFTQLANQTGLPAMSIPAGISSKNIPLGVHFMSGYAKDHLLLRLAKQLEETPIWFRPQKK
ncbi:Aspartyl-tRNA(Asn) amidotransferase subunit A / Glutamyl-tRNA(Gln) amidotransferase subunit A [Desulfurella amilsii]|uniref:Aspartyl-tRNA(Asn) amidotransferase subunit A / Glutamyl-tRNA(Gln) amidotransferase subunit A n=1 Tax=Desulfurella amilsii TaxID=1562698 RepID=A0A1X4Y050_9BACT|nr:amidase family protein [Desulfurella amilsii]OSS43144.1 Aspartyl-tRNA(Asn) amidotransferase subunit A / Glutamyl-tRNA(Gln) amidotransferase subunit A [Desulfurella amilsii]